MITVINGKNDKPAASPILVECLGKISSISGECFIGYPIIPVPGGNVTIDAILISPEKGIILFDLIEGELDESSYRDRQDDAANRLESKLKVHKNLLTGRKLKFDINVISFCPNLVKPITDGSSYLLANSETLESCIGEIQSAPLDAELYKSILSAIEGITTIRSSNLSRTVENPDSLGAKLQQLEKSIATLDQRQAKAVIETVDGVQRIRGLAGSGKTIVLALKAAYLHTQFPDWEIAVTFHTRALKGQYKRLITTFCIEQGIEPDWSKIHILNAWGAPGGTERTGLYYQYCQYTGQKHLDYSSAKYKYNKDNPFDDLCRDVIKENKEIAIYDLILVDEAQDFSSNFLKLCFFMLKAPRRLVYAYDELQNLSGESLPSPEEIFGKNMNGKPRVVFSDNLDRRDIILEKCYRNSRPVLATAHALGFGVYRKPSNERSTGLVQMFNQTSLWSDVGYDVKKGRLELGEEVVLERNAKNSPRFLEDHSDINELIQFKSFSSREEQNQWLVTQLNKNITEDELKYNDIIVINPSPVNARYIVAPIRQQLFHMGIQSHLAGIDNNPDIFFEEANNSITFTSIYRAKGNESGMVYIINADDCNGAGHGLALLRNQLFTAITRSKAWVRVLGVGSKMDELIEEFNTVKANNFELHFRYPTEEELKTLRIVHRDLSEYEKNKILTSNRELSDLLESIKSGTINVEDVDQSLLQEFVKLANHRNE